MDVLTSLNIKKVDKDIISFLIFSSDYVTSYDIASHCGITQRQVRNEMPRIMDIISQLGCQIISKQSRGYSIPDSSDKKYLEELFNTPDNNLMNKTWNGARQSQLIELLFNNDDHYLKINDISDALFLSRSSVLNEIKKSQHEVLDKNGVTIENKPHVGVRIVGPELQKRRMILDCVFNVFGQTETINKFLDLFYDHPNSTESQIFQILKKYQISLSDIALTDFVLYIIFANQRIIKGKLITETEDISDIKANAEYHAAMEIGKLLGDTFDYEIPETEVATIAIMLVSKRSTKKMAVNYNPVAVKIAANSLDEIHNKMRIAIVSDSFYASFLKYINNTILTLRFHEKVRNPLYLEAAYNYPLAYEMTKITADIFERETGYKMTSSHKTYYTILFQIAIIRNSEVQKRALLVDGFGTAATIATTKLINNAVGQSLTIADSCMYFELDQKNLSHYDFIISTIPIFKTLSIPVANISQFVTTDDVKKIVNIIHSSDPFDFKPELYLNPNLFEIITKPKTISDFSSSAEECVSKYAPQLSRSHIHTIISNNEDKVEIFPNGVASVVLNHTILPCSSIITCLTSNPISYKNQKITAVLFFFLEAKDTYMYDAMQNVLQSIDRNSLQKYIQDNGDYPSFIDLLKETRESI